MGTMNPENMPEDAHFEGWWQDQNAFHALVNGTMPRVVKYLSWKVKDFHEAQALAIDTFYRAYEKRKSYRRGDRVMPWLLTIAHNIAVDWLRSKERSFFKRMIGWLGFDDGLPTAVVESHMDILSSIDGEEAEQAVLDLPHPQRAIFCLYLLGRSWEEIAEITGLTVSEVQAIYRKARADLRRQLGDK